MNETTRDEIAALQETLLRLETKHEQSIAEINEKWQSKFESVEASMKQQGEELTEAKRELQEVHTTLLQQLTQPLPQPTKLLTEPRPSEQDAMDEILRVEDSPQQSLQCHQQSDHSAACNSNANVETNSDSSIEWPVQEELHADADHFLAQRELQFEIIQQQLEMQDRQLKSVQEGLNRAALDTESLHYEQNKLRQSWSTNFEVIMEALKSVQDGPQGGLYGEIEKDAEPLVSDGAVTSASTAKLSNVIGHEVSLARDAKRECFELIQQENERMMRTWGAQFDDLALYIQDNLDSQRASIAEARTSTFEHVDAETQARSGVWNAQYNQLKHQVHQHSNEIHDLKEDQEKSLVVVVETLVNLKTKVQAITEQIKEQGNVQLCSEINMQKILQLMESKADQWSSTFSKCESELKLLKHKVSHITEETEEIAEDREHIQSILEESVQLFNATTKTSMELWTAQFSDLESRLQAQAKDNNAKVLDYEKLQFEMDDMRIAWNQKFVKLIRLVENQASSEHQVAQRAHRIEGGRDLPPCDSDPQEKQVSYTIVGTENTLSKKTKWRFRPTLFRDADAFCSASGAFYDLTSVDQVVETE